MKDCAIYPTDITRQCKRFGVQYFTLRSMMPEKWLFITIFYANCYKTPYLGPSVKKTMKDNDLKTYEQ